MFFICKLMFLTSMVRSGQSDETELGLRVRNAQLLLVVSVQFKALELNTDRLRKH